MLLHVEEFKVCLDQCIFASKFDPHFVITTYTKLKRDPIDSFKSFSNPLLHYFLRKIFTLAQQCGIDTHVVMSLYYAVFVSHKNWFVMFVFVK